MLLLTLLHAAGAGAASNVLLIVIDDVGTDSLRLYNPGTDGTFPATPTLDSLASSGIVFRRAYAYPTCSPTRSTLLTGRYGFRTGIGYALANPQTDPVLKSLEFTLPEILVAQGPNAVRCASIGKWHLSFGADEPNTLGGWEHFAGVLVGALPDYSRWPKTVDGSTQPLWSKYATTDNVDDALAWLGKQGSQPWFLWLALNAAHTPYHKPPNDLHTRDNLPDSAAAINAKPRPYFEAMIEAADTEIGRLLASVDRQTTTVILLGDNGTLGTVIQAPYDPEHSKGTLAEGGIRVPLVIAGAGVASPGRDCFDLVGTVDLFSTILDLAGADPLEVVPADWPIDSRSLMPILRDQPFTPAEPYLLSENFADGLDPGHAGRAVIGSRYKLIQLDLPREEFYDLQEDPLEQSNLLEGALTAEQSAELERLRRRLTAWVNVPPPPVIQTVRWGSQGLTLTTRAAHGTRHQLWQKTRVDDAWKAVTHAVIATEDSTVTLTDPSPPNSSALYGLSAVYE